MPPVFKFQLKNQYCMQECKTTLNCSWAFDCSLTECSEPDANKSTSFLVAIKRARPPTASGRRVVGEMPATAPLIDDTRSAWHVPRQLLILPMEKLRCPQR